MVKNNNIVKRITLDCLLKGDLRSKMIGNILSCSENSRKDGREYSFETEYCSLCNKFYIGDICQGDYFSAHPVDTIKAIEQASRKISKLHHHKGDYLHTATVLWLHSHPDEDGVESCIIPSTGDLWNALQPAVDGDRGEAIKRFGGMPYMAHGNIGTSSKTGTYLLMYQSKTNSPFGDIDTELLNLSECGQQELVVDDIEGTGMLNAALFKVTKKRIAHCYGKTLKDFKLFERR